MTAWQTIRETPRRLGEAAAQARPQLRSISSPPRRLASSTFALLVVGLFMSGMVANLVLTTLLQNQAFAVRKAQAAASELSYRASDLEAQVNRAQAPAMLGERAAALGMVPNPHAVFIDLSSGEVLGKPVPATGAEIPSLTMLPPVVEEVPPADAPKAPAVDPTAEPAAAVEPAAPTKSDAAAEPAAATEPSAAPAPGVAP